MPVYNLFSKRQRDAAKAGTVDVYRYDIVPATFRIQLLNIAKAGFGPDRETDYQLGMATNGNWIWIDETYSHEKGIIPLGGDSHTPDKIRAAYQQMNAEDAIDLTELIGFALQLLDEKEISKYARKDYAPDLRMDEVNYRLREAGMGYQFERGRLIRVDSQFIHSEVVKPALSLLNRSGFEGAEQEFLKAHEHYRSGKNKEAVAMAANALESTFKGIFDSKGWEYSGSRISDLVKVAQKHKLWPDYLDNSFNQLVATLQSGLPKIRDNDASHGQGSIRKEVPSYLAGYALHLAASKIVFLVSAADG